MDWLVPWGLLSFPMLVVVCSLGALRGSGPWLFAVV
jgi:hypothetical protein